MKKIKKWKLLISLLCVVFIFILFSPKLICSNKNKKQSTHLQLIQIAQIINIYKADYKRYPSQKELILFLKETSLSHFSFLDNEKMPNDSWGNPFIYRLNNNSYILYSIGENKLDDQAQNDDIFYKESTGFESK